MYQSSSILNAVLNADNSQRNGSGKCASEQLHVVSRFEVDKEILTFCKREFHFQSLEQTDMQKVSATNRSWLKQNST